MMQGVLGALGSGGGFAQLSQDIATMNRNISALYEEMRLLRLEIKRQNDRAEGKS